ncbi:endonuclease V-like isoform X2 [Pseudoliparis swirei]|uniref:endonuclease V-like isoform X2 n=1 Tax=Pseudoliparis swirei TaxID=2059687 RepID=UPI0024BE3091|nr:endonuclease V-like isoform X2 [Pseudoliparis swirei]XP_056266131.1 endonuclease V-like isoform X2 [Pseudoliparis swirei]
MFAPPGEELVHQWESEQARLRLQLVEEDTEAWQRSPGFSGLERVGGVDLSFIKGDDVNACAQLVVLSFPDLELLYEDSQMVTLTAPYMAGFLAFRETPFLLEALRRLERNRPELRPQVVFVDGNGLLHYRDFISAERRRQLPPHRRLRESAGKGPEELGPELQARLRVAGSHDQPGDRRPPHTPVLPPPGPRAHQTGRLSLQRIPPHTLPGHRCVK